MTLIQTFFSNDFVIQVADRRLTLTDGSVFDDEHTKMVCWNHSFSAGFTGLAFVDRRQSKSTSEYVAEILSGQRDFGYGLNVLRTELEATIRKLPTNFPEKRLAVVVAGFEGNRGPLCAEVANFDTSTGRTADPNTFVLNPFGPLPGRDTGAHSAGAPLTRMQSNLIGRYVPRIVRQPKGVNRSITAMVQNQRLVAAVHGTVGQDALCVMIPRVRSAHNMVMSNLGGPELSTANTSFGFYGAGGYQFQQYGPLMAHGGGVVTDVQAWADPDNPDNQTISARIW